MTHTTNEKWYHFVTDNYPYLFHSSTSKLLKLPPTVYNNLLSHNNFEENPSIKDLDQHLKKNHHGKQKIQVDIQSIALNIIEKCNLACNYCYAQKGTYGNPSVMTFETAKKAIRLFSQERPHPLLIKFFGGEPLLNFDLIKKVVLWCKNQHQYKYNYSITTNGTLLNKQHIKFFEENQVKVTISYDGHKIQDQQRPTKTKVNGYGKLVQYKLEKYASDLKKLQSSYIRSTVTNLSVDFLEELISEILMKYQLPSGLALSATKDSLSLECQNKFITALENICNKYLKKRDYDSILKLMNIKNHLRQIHRGAPKTGFCGAGIHYLSVSSEGKFYLCHRFTEDKNHCLGDTETGLKTKRIQQIINYRNENRKPCNTCWVRNHCRGGCFHENQLKHNSIFQVDYFYCSLLKKEFSIALKVYASIKENRPKILHSI